MFYKNLLEAGIIPDKPEEVTDKDIIRCRDYYGIDVEGLIKFGSWIVNKRGDIVNADRDYSVFEDQIRADGDANDLLCWICHMRGKTWFNAVCEHDFISSFIYAILAKMLYKQERMNGRTTDKTRD